VKTSGNMVGGSLISGDESGFAQYLTKFITPGCASTPPVLHRQRVQLQQYTCNGTGAQEFSLAPA
jgi:hypothetical protein